MSTNDTKQLTLEELEKRSKVLVILTCFLGGVLLVSVGLGLYVYIKRSGKITSSLLTPLALLPILIINISNIKRIKAEIKSRQ